MILLKKVNIKERKKMKTNKKNRIRSKTDQDELNLPKPMDTRNCKWVGPI